LIELLVAMAIVGLLLSIVTPRYFGSITRAEESVLKENLFLLRDAIDKHFADTGRYPDSLDQLATKHYIRMVPDDPITKSSAGWTIIAPADAKLGAVYDIKSSAKGIGRNGKPYEEW
jgi:general secretion pathway protein G